MKRKLLFLLVGLWCAWSGNAASAQNRQGVTVNLGQAGAEQVINAMKGSSGYEFIYRVEDLADVPRRDYQFTNATIQQVMGRMVEGTAVTYGVRNNQVTISRQRGQQPGAGVISGRVVDEDGNPLSGASVVIAGVERGSTGRGAATDNSGQFRFNNISGNSVRLTVSYMGMKTRNVVVSVGRPETITLQADAATIDQVVVTGLFDRPGDSFTGAAKTFSGTELQRVGSGNIFQSLRNLDPSINMIDNMEFGSDPNRLPSIEMRGTTSILADGDGVRRMYENDPNMPLFILDGFRVDATRVFDLDMSRIASVTTLKDAAAKAIYGADAANGVIVIETVKPKGGRLGVTYRGSADIQMPDLSSYDLTNALEKLAVEKLSGVYEQNTTPDGLLLNQAVYNRKMNQALSGTNTDWLSKPVRLGLGTKHALSVDVTEGSLSFRGDLSYNGVTGVMKGSSRRTIAGVMDVSYRRQQKFLFRNQMSISSNKGVDSPWGSFSQYAAANPYESPYDSYGNLVEGFSTINQTTVPNPMYNIQFNTSLTSNYLLFSDNFYAEYYPIEGLTIRLRGNVETQRDKREDFYPSGHTMFRNYETGDRARKGKYTLMDGRRDRLSADLSVMYNKTWNEKHLLMSNFNYNMNQNQMREVTVEAEGFPSDKMNDIMFARQYAKDGRPTGSETIVREMSFTGLASYVYDSRLMADFTLRGSASSQYSPKKRWGVFWSAGVAWNMHKEQWAKDHLGWIDLMKLRGSVGTVGTQNVQSYASISTYEYYADQFYDMGSLSSGFGAVLKKMANENLKWQQTLECNIGFDAMLWDRLNVQFDYYVRTTHDLIADFTLPPSTGYTSFKENVGDTQNKGFDLTLVYRLVNRDDFYFNITGGLSMNDNKIIKLSDAMKAYNDRQNSMFVAGDHDGDGTIDEPKYLPLPKYVEGGSLTSIWGMVSMGIDPATGEEILIRRDGIPTYGRNYSAAEQQIIGNSREKFRGTFGFNGEYKGFGLSMTCRFIAGGDYYNQTLLNKVENIDINQNVDRRVFTGRWSETNRNAPYKAFRVWNSGWGGWENAPKTQATSRFLQKRDDLTIGSVSAWYDLNKIRAIDNLGFRRLRLGFNMNELYVFSTIQMERGTDYPFARTMSFSLTAEF